MTQSGSSRPHKSASSAVAGGRLGKIIRGYLGACFVAAWALPLGLILEDVLAGHHIGGQFSDFGVVVGGIFIVVLVSAAPLATAAIMISEATSIRWIWFYLAAGAVIGLIIELIAMMFVGPSPLHINAPLLCLVAAVGGLAGAVYWFLAVRQTRPVDAKVE